MKFYLNDKEIKVLNGATFSLKKDETLDSGKIELVFSDNDTPIAPMSLIRIEDNGETYNFLVINDIVEVASKKPKTYLHTLTFAQNTKKFSKIQVRNTQFSQPAKNSLKCGCNATFLNNNTSSVDYMRTINAVFDLTSYKNNYYSYSMQISNRHKVKNAFLKINCSYAKFENTTSLIYNNYTMQDSCPELNISFEVYKDDTLFFVQSGSFSNGDILYTDRVLEDGTYAIKNIKVSRLNNSSYNTMDLFIVNVALVCNVYYYSLYDVLDILRKQIALQENNEITYIYDLPTSGELYDILTNTIAPNLTFTQCNLFECLSQIFMYLDGYPVLTKDNVLDIRYFNDNNGEINELEPSDSKKTISEERYVNGLMTDFQNAELNNVITYPTAKTFSNVQSKSIGIADNNSYIMRVDQPIYKLRSVKIMVGTISLYDYWSYGGSSSQDYYVIKFNNYIDIVDNVVPQDIYITLESSKIDRQLASENLYRENCLYWEQKSNTIDVSEKFKNFIITEYVMPYVLKSAVAKIFGSTGYENNEITPNFIDVKEQLKYQIEYETLTNGRLLIEGTQNKYNGAERLDIGQGGSDIMKTGLNLLGTSIKTGINTLVRTEKFAKNENRIKIGSLYYENGERYIATQVDEVILGDFVFSTIQYTKNFNKLSQFIVIDQKKRFNEIDSSLTLRSEDVYKEYLYFTLNSPSNDLANDIHIKSVLLESGLVNTFALNPQNNTRIDFATCETKNYDGSSNSAFGKVWLPMVQYGAGNALCFEMAFNSPINANSNFQYNETNNNWFSKYILYTANDGFADTFTINFYNQIANYETDNLPQVSNEMVSASYANNMGGFKDLHYYKKPNEIFAMNYELLCLPYNNEEIFIGENFIKYNGIIGNAVPKQKLKLFISDTKLYSMFDKQALGTEQSGTFSISIFKTLNNSNRATYGLRIHKDGKIYLLDKKIVSWALCDENNEIYISANQNKNENDNLTFYIFTSHSRL